MLDRTAESVGNAADVLAELAGTVGLPLGDCASANVARDCQFILGKTAGASQSPNPGTDTGRGLLHIGGVSA